MPPYLVREPLEPVASVSKLACRQRGRVIGEMSRQLNQFVEELAEGDILAPIA